MTFKKNTFFSIIIPAYNAESTLKRCVDSVINQSYSNLEVILIDDGSRDTTGYIARDYSLRDSRVRYVSQSNRGVSFARNKGIELSKGDYILFVDSDDQLCDGSLRFLNETLLKKNVDIMIASFVGEQDGGRNIIFSNFDGSKTDFRKHLPVFVRNRSILSPCAKAYRRRFLQINKIKFCEAVSVAEDFLFNIDCFSKSIQYYYENRPVYNYNTHHSSLSVGLNTTRVSSAEMVLESGVQLCTQYGVDDALPYFAKYFFRSLSLHAKMLIERNKDVSSILNTGSIGTAGAMLSKSYDLESIFYRFFAKTRSAVVLRVTIFIRDIYLQVSRSKIMRGQK